MTAQDIAQEINCKLGYYREVFRDKPELLENLVIIIPDDKYEILSDIAVNYFMTEAILHDARQLKFDRFMGVPLKIAQQIDKIYIALNLDYDNKNESLDNKNKDYDNNVKQLQQAMINCIDCKFYEHDEEFMLSYCSLDGVKVIDASKHGCEVGEQQKEHK